MCRDRANVKNRFSAANTARTLVHNPIEFPIAICEQSDVGYDPLKSRAVTDDAPKRSSWRKKKKRFFFTIKQRKKSRYLPLRKRENVAGRIGRGPPAKIRANSNSSKRIGILRVGIARANGARIRVRWCDFSRACVLANSAEYCDRRWRSMICEIAIYLTLPLARHCAILSVCRSLARARARAQSLRDVLVAMWSLFQCRRISWTTPQARTWWCGKAATWRYGARWQEHRSQQSRGAARRVQSCPTGAKVRIFSRREGEPFENSSISDFHLVCERKSFAITWITGRVWMCWIFLFFKTVFKFYCFTKLVLVKQKSRFNRFFLL